MNSLYTTQDQKQRYYNNPEMYINGFWISLLCTLGFKIIKPNHATLNQQLNRFYMTLFYSQDGFVDDTLPDHIIAIKVLRELNIINFIQCKSLFTFLDKNKTNINQADLRKVLKSLPFYKIRPNSFYSNEINDFLNGKKKLEQIIYRLFLFNSNYRISEFINKYGILFRNDLIKEK